MGLNFTKEYQTKNGAVLRLYKRMGVYYFYTIQKIKSKGNTTLYFKPVFNKDKMVIMGMLAIFRGKNFYQINPVHTVTDDDEKNRQLLEISQQNEKLLTELLKDDVILD